MVTKTLSGIEKLEKLRGKGPLILPSMLICDFTNLEREVRELEDAGVEGFHLDVMDGSFVPNMTYGMPIVEAFRRLTDLPLDVHLMIDQPQKYVDQFCDAGADIVTFHIEATDDPEPIIQTLKRKKVGVGIALNPMTPVSRISPYLPFCDLALVMSVLAGFGGQSFEPIALKKVQEIHDASEEKLIVEMDGGLNANTITSAAKAGTEWLVVGSAIFNESDYSVALEKLNGLIR